MRVIARSLVGLGVLAALLAALAGAARAAPTGTYVVVLRHGVTDVPRTASGLARASGGSTGFVYRRALHGFSIRVPAAGAALIARSPLVEYVEADREFTVSAQSMPTGIARVRAPDNAGLDIDGVDDERVDVDIAVIDSGIDLDHPDLNVVGSTNCATLFSTCGSGGDDGNGHGTHVAGTIGALDNGLGVVGIAPGARLWAVRVLNSNGTGTTSQIIAGMDWVTARASTIEVANISIVGGASAAVDNAANRMADAGIAVTVAAGNNDADASGYSPARAAKVLTVSAVADYDGLSGGLAPPPSSFCLDQDDTLADFSNWGSTIEIAAPGCRILSTYLGGGYAWINGTSMASPHVAGALGVLASKGFQRNFTGVSSLYDTVKGKGNFAWTDESGDGVQEPLLDVSDAAVFDPSTVAGPDGGGPPPNRAPTASFTYSCTSLACSFDASGSSDSDGSIASYSWAFGDSATGTGATAAHAYASGGTYSVTLTVTDDDGATGNASSTLAVTPLKSVALSGLSTSNGSRWTANVLITVSTGALPAPGVTVAGAWSNGASGAASCTTGSGGQCSVSKSGIRNSVGSVRFTVNTVGGSSTFAGTKSATVSKP